eukprot:6492717-Amphidinium_carterae.3
MTTSLGTVTGSSNGVKTMKTQRSNKALAACALIWALSGWSLLNLAVKAGRPDDIWQQLGSAIDTVCREQFCCKRAEPAEHSQHTKGLLEERAALRVQLVNAIGQATGDQIHDLNLLIKHAKREDWLQYQQRLVQELEAAHREGQWRLVFMLARRITGKRIGPKKRRYDVPPRERLSLDAWKEYFEQPPSAGGCLATEIREPTAGRRSGKSQERMAHCVGRSRSRCMPTKALLARSLQTLPCRAAVPAWALPPSLWKGLARKLR